MVGIGVCEFSEIGGVEIGEERGLKSYFNNFGSVFGCC
jgi:hypothetical protein